MFDPILDNITSVEEIDCGYLTRLIRKAGIASATVISFTQECAGGKSHGGGSIFRFRLTYSDQGSVSAPPSIVLKESREIASQSLDPAFARREADCYHYDLFKDMNEKLYIPNAYHLVIRPELGIYWVWLEDLGSNTFDLEWTPAILKEMIHDISELHRTWWGRSDELSKMPYLRYRAQAMYDGLWVDRIAQNCNSIDNHPQSERISRVFTTKRRSILMRLSQAAAFIYPKLEALPQTLLHHDIWPPNLGRYSEKTVLIDWSYAGQGTPGADLSQTVALLFQMWDPNLDDEALLHALWSGLREDSRLPIEFDEIAAGYELAFCLRPAHALGGPVLGGILSGKGSMVGDSDLEGKLASAEAVLQRVERGIRRLDG
ncbi:aminoglycoside phosphotransferase family protein [Paenibacillus radicis (ex Xue et al. 2023)]|uniref:Aminoglycoside phosphotransferase family protein n=1 Tax=Paenibacillus radicis (ex Xue et al. 2023) TaxID=2972489 RepID=A0ABT1YBH8_9BACL|nr:aminoglycoside phosphotransferase family protein [Paenibacillus radicis (ex Xue et al. 2023)]MCR8630547.1 aminoglycoside phosphotransferase family protein [Paenibacillus radicis (ex Xue et al. 2023)]